MTRRSPASKRPSPYLAWCETAYATPTSPFHIRVVPAGDELVTGGGLRVNALCGRDLERGWDTHAVVGREEISEALANRHPTNNTCQRCADAAFAWYERDGAPTTPYAQALADALPATFSVCEVFKPHSSAVHVFDGKDTWVVESVDGLIPNERSGVLLTLGTDIRYAKSRDALAHVADLAVALTAASGRRS